MQNIDAMMKHLAHRGIYSKVHITLWKNVYQAEIINSSLPGPIKNMIFYKEGDRYLRSGEWSSIEGALTDLNNVCREGK